MPNPRWRWRAPRSTRRNTRSRARGRGGGDPHAAARGRLSAARRHRGGRDRRPGPGPAVSSPRRCARRAIRPGWPTAIVSERWAPVSPVTGKLDAFEWRVPIERLGQLIEQDEPSRCSPTGSAPAAPAESRMKPVAEDARTTASQIALREADRRSIAAVAVPRRQSLRQADASEATEQGLAARACGLPDDPGVDPQQAGKIAAPVPSVLTAVQWLGHWGKTCSIGFWPF